MPTQPITTVISENKSYGAELASKHIVDAINSIAKIKTEQINVQKSLMLDEINRNRNLRDKRKEKEMELEFEDKKQKYWMSMMGQQDQPEDTSSSEVASPVQLPQIPNIPQRGQAQITTQQQPQSSLQQMTAPTLNGVPLQKPLGKLMMTPEGPKRRTMTPEQEAANTSYTMIYDKLARGENITEGEKRLALEFNGYKAQTATEKKAQMEIDEKAHFEEKQAKEEKTFAADMLKTIGEIENGLRYFGIEGAIHPAVTPFDTQKINWRANFDKLVSQRTIDTMTHMKQASKTGATGFGQLSNKELAVLENASTVLKRNMSEKDAKRYLEEMKIPLMKILDNEKSKENKDQNETEAAAYIQGILFK